MARAKGVARRLTVVIQASLSHTRGLPLMAVVIRSFGSTIAPSDMSAIYLSRGSVAAMHLAALRLIASTPAFSDAPPDVSINNFRSSSHSLAVLKVFWMLQSFSGAFGFVPVSMDGGTSKYQASMATAAVSRQFMIHQCPSEL